MRPSFQSAKKPDPLKDDMPLHLAKGNNQQQGTYTFVKEMGRKEFPAQWRGIKWWGGGSTWWQHRRACQWSFAGVSLWPWLWPSQRAAWPVPVGHCCVRHQSWTALPLLPFAMMMNLFHHLLLHVALWLHTTKKKKKKRKSWATF